MEENYQPRVLIIDDQPKNIQVLGQFLRAEDFSINVAKSGQAGLDMIEGVNPDIILLDILMPDIDGFEVCKKIRENDKTKEIPIIFVSAVTDMEKIIHGFKIGGNDYITKPFNQDELLARVKTHIDLYRSKVLIKDQQEKILETQKFELLFKTCGLVAHEIFNPLTIVSGNLYSVQKWLAKNAISTDDKIHQKVKSAMDASDRIVVGVNKIRGFKVEDIEGHDWGQINKLKKF